VANSKDFVAHVLEMMRPVGSASARAMFGGHGVYLEGLIVGIVDDDVLYLKTDAATRFIGSGSARKRSSRPAVMASEVR